MAPSGSAHAITRSRLLPRLRRRVRRDGDLRQARLRRGRHGRHAARHSVHARRARALDRGRVHATRAAPDGCAAPGSLARPGDWSDRLRRAGGRLLLGARTARRVAPVAARVQLPGDGHGGRGRARPREGERAQRRRTYARVGRARSRACRRRRRGARSARDRTRARHRIRVQRVRLVSEGIAARLGPLMLSTLVCSGAALALTLAALIGGDLAPGRVSAEGYAWLAGLALVSTVAAIGLFFAGLRRTGPSAAAILSTLEPVVTVGLAYVAFGE